MKIEKTIDTITDILWEKIKSYGVPKPFLKVQIERSLDEIIKLDFTTFKEELKKRNNRELLKKLHDELGSIFKDYISITLKNNINDSYIRIDPLIYVHFDNLNLKSEIPNITGTFKKGEVDE